MTPPKTRKSRDPIRERIAGALAWHSAHATFDDAVKGLAPALRGRRVRGSPHSVWELVEHIRLAQRDILDFCRNASYVAPAWPHDYWPPTPAPRAPAAWNASLTGYRRDLRALQRLVRDRSRPLEATTPHGSGQTYLHEVLLVIDHTAYHVGEIVALRQRLGAWPKR
jgi:uncharacterized damage-inducible protein DinB